MGTGPNSAIIAVGAVRFDVNGVSDRFYEVVDLQSCLDIGLSFDASTVIWWMGRSEAARDEFKRKGSHICEVLQKFSQWIVNAPNEPIVWGNGAAFDNVLLANAYSAAKHATPWKFWNDRCYRTIKALHPQVSAKRIGTYHNAVNDAETQAVHLISILGPAL
jgi:exodeoxyribonuclease VIII